MYIFEDPSLLSLWLEGFLSRLHRDLTQDLLAVAGSKCRRDRKTTETPACPLEAYLAILADAADILDQVSTYFLIDQVSVGKRI